MLWRFFQFSLINVVTTFKVFAPNSAGNYKTRARQTILTINSFPSAMIEFLEKHVNPHFSVQTVPEFLDLVPTVSHSGILGDYLIEFGSDKSNVHNYDLIYESILGDPSKVDAILEIGLGTNNTKIISTMGITGKPGASLRAFKSYCPNARIFGADVDREILFSEERIQTFFVDQLQTHTFFELKRNLPSEFDLVIDDGLHSLDANLRTLTFGLPLLKVGGWLVIEDIGENSLDLWKLIGLTFPKEFSTSLVLAKKGALFLVQKL